MSRTKDNDGIVAEIRAIVAVVLLEGGLKGEIGDHEPLRRAGVDSLGLVNLIFQLESAFHLIIPDDRINLEALSSISSIASLIQDLKSGNTHPSVPDPGL
jgi:acyl carrier protein